MDEVGRGTTVKDGLAIAFATIHHLVSVNQCRALFATHFHELADMLGYSNDRNGCGIFENVSFFCTDIDETDVSVELLHTHLLYISVLLYRTVVLRIHIVCGRASIVTVMA
jgi:DNA mismatch repair ATPase MutS